MENFNGTKEEIARDEDLSLLYDLGSSRPMCPHDETLLNSPVWFDHIFSFLIRKKL